MGYRNLMPCRFFQAVVLVLGLAFASDILGSGLKQQSRMAIVRGLTAEYATVKVSLPRGQKGLLLKVGGQIDEESLKHEITQNGTAVPPNILVQITQIEFRENEVILEINGGGKRKTKWYEHIEVGLGSGTRPITTGKNEPTSTGSTISLLFAQKLPDLTVAELKSYLAPVLDFNPTTPLQAISRPIPPEFQKAIEAKQAVVGMDRDMVVAALGQPDRKVRETKDGVEQEDWIYGTPPLKVTFVTFEEDEVVNVQEYTGGVGGQTQPYVGAEPR